ncbi:MAG: hypothetical protein MUF15_23840 [Acidobacteria bacterium]|nr:hypothetical protein [Acidobacteriota bacterium]
MKILKRRLKANDGTAVKYEVVKLECDSGYLIVCIEEAYNIYTELQTIFKDVEIVDE